MQLILKYRILILLMLRCMILMLLMLRYRILLQLILWYRILMLLIQLGDRQVTNVVPKKKLLVTKFYLFTN